MHNKKKQQVLGRKLAVFATFFMVFLSINEVTSAGINPIEVSIQTIDLLFDSQAEHPTKYKATLLRDGQLWRLIMVRLGEIGDSRTSKQMMDLAFDGNGLKGCFQHSTGELERFAFKKEQNVDDTIDAMSENVLLCSAVKNAIVLMSNMYEIAGMGDDVIGKRGGEQSQSAYSKSGMKTPDVLGNVMCPSIGLHASDFNDSVCWYVTPDKKESVVVEITQARRVIIEGLGMNDLMSIEKGYDKIPSSVTLLTYYQNCYDELVNTVSADTEIQLKALYSKVSEFEVNERDGDLNWDTNVLLLKIAIASENQVWVQSAFRKCVDLIVCDDISIKTIVSNIALLLLEERGHLTEECRCELFRSTFGDYWQSARIANPYLLREILTPLNQRYWLGIRNCLIEMSLEGKFVPKEVLIEIADELDNIRLCRHIDETAEVVEYPETFGNLVRSLNNPPPTGMVAVGDLEHVILKAFETNVSKVSSDERRKQVDRTMSIIQLIGGNGPFRCDLPLLESSIHEWVAKSSGKTLSSKSFPEILATLITLSFYDYSSEDDHQLLLNQIRIVEERMVDDIMSILEKYEMGNLVSDEQFGRMLDRVMGWSVDYIENPLWPMFKYPLSENEEERLYCTLRTFEIKLQSECKKRQIYLQAGINEDQVPKERIFMAIRGVIDRMLPSLFQQRLVSDYPLGCMARGGEMNIIFQRSFYSDEEAGKEFFNQMLYMFLGHRTDTVKIAVMSNRSQDAVLVDNRTDFN